MEITNEFLKSYLAYTENTESPKIFHLWAAISGVAACLGRRVFYPFAVGDIFPNMYVLLVGPPATRKSTAINIMKDLVKKNTGVRFAPKDTAGQRQGLITAIHSDTEQDELVLQSLGMNDSISLNAFEMNGSRQSFIETEIDLRDRHTLYVTAGEFASFIGNNNSDMLTFLIEMFDGTDYDYQLKTSKLVIEKPLLNLIGGTTPTSLSDCLPEVAIGQGFMSRIILVFAAKKWKSVEEPTLRDDLGTTIGEVFKLLHENWDGPIGITASARNAISSFYDKELEISDPRFVHYIERRSTHLKKLATILACARLSKDMEAEDIIQADEILKYTEVTMPDALGEYGMSPLAGAKQRLLEFITHTNAAVPISVIYSVMYRDMKKNDIISCLNDLHNAGKIVRVDTNSGPAYVRKETAGRKDKTGGLVDLISRAKDQNNDTRDS